MLLYTTGCLILIMLDEPLMNAISGVFNSPGPMMVYALTMNVTTVLGGEFVSVWFVSDVLMQVKFVLWIEQTSY